MLLSDRSAYTLVEALVVMEVRGVLVRVQSVTSVEHKCGNPGCVNPWHLELLTNEENAIRWQRGPQRQRAHRGSSLLEDAMQCFRVDFCRRVNGLFAGQLDWLDREELYVIAETAQEAIRMVEQIYVGTASDEGECVAIDVLEVECELDVAAWPGRDLKETRIDIATEND